MLYTLVEIIEGVLVVQRLLLVLFQECLILIGACCGYSGGPTVMRSQLVDDEIDRLLELGARNAAPCNPTVGAVSQFDTGPLLIVGKRQFWGLEADPVEAFNPVGQAGSAHVILLAEATVAELHWSEGMRHLQQG